MDGETRPKKEGKDYAPEGMDYGRGCSLGSEDRAGPHCNQTQGSETRPQTDTGSQSNSSEGQNAQHAAA